MNSFTGDGSGSDEEKGLLWKLPEVRMKDLGKVGPAFGFGAGCGVGFGVGMIGGFGIGPGIPGLQAGIGFGAGCGFGYGFGYGVGKGVAHDHNRRYSNVGNRFLGRSTLSTTQDEIGALLSEFAVKAEKRVKAIARDWKKWMRDI